MIDLEKLEALAKAATPGPWVVGEFAGIHNGFEGVAMAYAGKLKMNDNAAYIVDACNSLPDLIAENRALREKVRELEKRNQRLEVRVRNFAYYLENFCRYHGENDGRCPIFYRCPAPALEKSCGDMKRDDWFWDMEQAAKEAGE